MEYLLARLADPLLVPAHPAERLYWLYVASAVLIAFAVFAARAGRITLRGFLAFCLPRRVLLHASALLDYRYYLVNRVMFGLLMLPAAPAAALAAIGGTVVLLDALAGRPVDVPAASAASLVLQTVLSALAMDLGLFLSHKLQHDVPLLWQFHKVHHSAEVLTPVTAYRIHPVDDLLSMGLSGALGGIVTGIFQYLQPGNPGAAVLLGLHACVFLYYLAGFNLRHSHVWLGYGWRLSHLLISPAQHQIHHSMAQRHYGKNLGFIFAFWDWFAGTLYVPREREELAFGLPGDEGRHYASVRRLYFLPFARAFQEGTRSLALCALGAVLLVVCFQSIVVAWVALGN